MYDVTIIGAGVAGVFLAYQLAESNHKVLIMDKGKPILDRFCPIDKGHTCDCERCDTYFGFGGLGKSEGKFNYSSGFGGELEKKVGSEVFQRLMNEVDNVICRFGGIKRDKYSTENMSLSKRALASGLQLISTEVRHLGTALSTHVFQQLYEYLQRNQVQMQFETDVLEIKQQEDCFHVVTDERTIKSKNVVIATGRSGAEWLHQIWDTFGIKQEQTRVDLGIRVEMKAEQFRFLLQDTFETKLAYQEGEVSATTYCMNPQGRIVRKYQDGLVMPDGQNFREQGDSGTANLNFTLFVPKYFSTLQTADAYAREIITHINRGRDRIVVQRWEDLCQEKATTAKKMEQNQVQPTLRVDFGNVAKELPSIYIRMLQNFLIRLEKLTQEPIHPDTLLYGIDAKFYAPIIQTDSFMQTQIQGLYAIGDCSGVTHSLSQAAASGIYVGEHLKFERFVCNE